MLRIGEIAFLLASAVGLPATVVAEDFIEKTVDETTNKCLVAVEKVMEQRSPLESIVKENGDHVDPNGTAEYELAKRCILLTGLIDAQSIGGEIADTATRLRKIVQPVVLEDLLKLASTEDAPSKDAWGGPDYHRCYGIAEALILLSRLKTEEAIGPNSELSKLGDQLAEFIIESSHNEKGLVRGPLLGSSSVWSTAITGLLAWELGSLDRRSSNMKAKVSEKAGKAVSLFLKCHFTGKAFTYQAFSTSTKNSVIGNYGLLWSVSLAALPCLVFRPDSLTDVVRFVESHRNKRTSPDGHPDYSKLTKLNRLPNAELRRIEFKDNAFYGYGKAAQALVLISDQDAKDKLASSLAIACNGVARGDLKRFAFKNGTSEFGDKTFAVVGTLLTASARILKRNEIASSADYKDGTLTLYLSTKPAVKLWGRIFPVPSSGGPLPLSDTNQSYYKDFRIRDVEQVVTISSNLLKQALQRRQTFALYVFERSNDGSERSVDLVLLQPEGG